MKIQAANIPQHTKLHNIVLADKLTKPARLIPGIPLSVEELRANPSMRLPPDLVQVCNELVLASHMHDGVGIAANQIGLDMRMFTINTQDKANPNTYKVYFHPSWKPSEGSTVEVEQEGCLSVPRTLLPVPRQTVIDVAWVEVKENGEFQFVETSYAGLLARAFQHEHNHLAGLSILDYASREIRRNKSKFIQSRLIPLSARR